MRKTKFFFALAKASDPKGILPDWIANQNLGYASSCLLTEPAM